jgi:hypothetical protein
MRNLLYLMLCALLAPAQQTVAPTPEPVGPARGENKGGYNIVQSYELGYRFRTVEGNYATYRSDVNFGNGVRLLSSKLSINSREGHGKFFDEITLSTLGLGNDPYQFSNLRIQKNGLYRYDMLWRLTEYYNPGLEPGISHLMDTRRRLQDHDLTLFPQSKYRFFLGYTRNNQTGPALTSVQVFDSRGNEFPLFANVRRSQNEYRLGAEAELFGMRLNVLHAWDNFKEDTPSALFGPSTGFNPQSSTTLSRFTREEPRHGNNPFWRATLIRNRGKWAANARYTYVSGQRDFVLSELAIGTDRLGLTRNRQVVVTGNGRQPMSEGALTLSLFPTEKLTIANHTAFHNSRMSGDNAYLEINNATGSDVLVNFGFLGIRTISNATDLNYAVNKTVTVYSGYHFSTRRVQSNEGQVFSGVPEGLFYEQENTLHSGLAGVRLRPLKPLFISFDGEIGRADLPFFPIAEKNYHALGGRAWWKGKTFQFSAQARTFYNVNSISLFAHSARSRQYTLDASWMPKAWFGFDASYTKQHVDTATGVAYFLSGAFVNNNYIYVSNIHTGYFGAHFSVLKRADMYVGFSRVQDTGDGRTLVPTSAERADAVIVRDPIPLAQSFPLTFQSPQARLSIKLRNKVRWDAGYQYYSYGEGFFVLLPRSNYHAHTGYTSVLWSF